MDFYLILADGDEKNLIILKIPQNTFLDSKKFPFIAIDKKVFLNLYVTGTGDIKCLKHAYDFNQHTQEKIVIP